MFEYCRSSNVFFRIFLIIKYDNIIYSTQQVDKKVDTKNYFNAFGKNEIFHLQTPIVTKSAHNCKIIRTPSEL